MWVGDFKGAAHDDLLLTSPLHARGGRCPRRLDAPLGGADGTDHRAIPASAKVMTSLNTRTAPSIRVMASTAPVPSPKRIPDEGFRKEWNKGAVCVYARALPHSGAKPHHQVLDPFTPV
jgi:hypothetical protein